MTKLDAIRLDVGRASILLFGSTLGRNNVWRIQLHRGENVNRTFPYKSLREMAESKFDQSYQGDYAIGWRWSKPVIYYYLGLLWAAITSGVFNYIVVKT